MVTIKLEEYTDGDIKMIMDMRKKGFSDSEIQKKYDEEVRRREDGKADDV